MRVLKSRAPKDVLHPVFALVRSLKWSAVDNLWSLSLHRVTHWIPYHYHSYQSHWETEEYSWSFSIISYSRVDPGKEVVRVGVWDTTGIGNSYRSPESPHQVLQLSTISTISSKTGTDVYRKSDIAIHSIITFVEELRISFLVSTEMCIRFTTIPTAETSGRYG